MGDQITAGAGAVVINRAIVQNALNKVKERTGDDAARLLEQISRYVEESRNPKAVEMWEGFNKQLTDDPSKKTMLQSIWDGLVRVLPQVGSIATAAGGIAKLFA
jgi:hypothetical protein